MGLNSIQLLALLGFVLSYYAYTIEKKLQRSKNYKAVCDISKEMSCTTAFKSKYGHLAGFSNSVGGMVFYAAIYILTWMSLSPLIFMLAVFSFLGTLYLAYISFFKLKNFCMVCMSIYAVNILLLIISYGKVM